MVPINGRPLIDYQLDQLRRNGIKDVKVYESYLADILKDHLGNGSKLGMKIEHREQPFDAGSLGCIQDALMNLPEGENNLLVMYGDIFSDVNLREMTRQHLLDRPHATVAFVEHKNPYGVASSDDGVLISRFEEKPTNYENTGICIVSKEIANKIPDAGDFFGHAIQPIIKRGFHVYIYKHTGYWWDVRSMEIAKEIGEEIKEGRINLEQHSAGRSPEFR